MPCCKRCFNLPLQELILVHIAQHFLIILAQEYWLPNASVSFMASRATMKRAVVLGERKVTMRHIGVSYYMQPNFTGFTSKRKSFNLRSGLERLLAMIQSTIFFVQLLLIYLLHTQK